MNKRSFFFCLAFFISYSTYAQLPQAGIIIGNHYLCPGTCADFTNASTNATSYLWIFAGANPSTSTDVNPVTICYGTPGIYDVILVASNSFGSDTLFLNNYMTVYPYPPQIAIEYCVDTLFATQGFVSYQWYYNGNIINGAIYDTYIASVSGDYNVVAADVNGCEVEAVFWQVGGNSCNCCTGIDDMSMENSISVFPNPVSSGFVIKIASSAETSFFQIVNPIGEIVCSAKFNGKNEYVVNANLAKGIYYVRVSDAVKKLIIE